jgi:hypothetical protein
MWELHQQGNHQESKLLGEKALMALLYRVPLLSLSAVLLIHCIQLYMDNHMFHF